MRIFQPFFFAVALGFTFSIANAQQADQEQDQSPEAEETTQEDTSGQADTAVEAPADATTSAVASTIDGEQPPEEVVAVHGDWQIRCRTDTGACFMYQLAIDAREVPIAEMSIVPLDAEDGRVAGFTIVTPLRTLLPEGVTLQIDNGRQQKYQFGWCAEAGCAARFAVREDGLTQFKRGNKTRLTVLSVEKPDTPVILDVSLSGFTAAFNDLQSR